MGINLSVLFLCINFLFSPSFGYSYPGLNLRPSSNRRPSNRPSSSYQCGTRDIIDVPGSWPRGSDAPFGKYPWNAVIYESGRSKPIAGGTLIDNRRVVTTAHNVYNARMPLTVRLGEWDLGNRNEPYRHQSIDVANIRLHEDFSSVSLKNDIAVLTLEKTVTFGQHIRPLCLPRPGEDSVGKQCWVSGYGKTSELDNGGTLKEIAMEVISNRECEESLRNNGLSYSYELDSHSFMCAGGMRNKPACQGDGGYPLVCQQSGRFYFAGIVSWGLGCERGLPGVYTNLMNYVRWINRSRK